MNIERAKIKTKINSMFHISHDPLSVNERKLEGICVASHVTGGALAFSAILGSFVILISLDKLES